MSAYLLANITVNNPENYKEYVEKVKSIVEKFDGECASFHQRAGGGHREGLQGLLREQGD